MTDDATTTPTWTRENQDRVDNFQRQILASAAQLQGGNADEIPLAFLQTTSGLIQQRIASDPTCLLLYMRAIRMFVDSVVPVRDDSTTIRH